MGTFQDSCCQCPHPCGESQLTHASTGALQHQQVVLVQSPVKWLLLSSVLVCTRFCLCPPRLESLFPPVLWKSCNQIPLAFKVRSPAWEAWHRVHNLHNSGRTSLVLLFSSLWATHPAGMGFDFIIIVPLLLSRCIFLLVFRRVVSFFFGGPSVLLLMVV